MALVLVKEDGTGKANANSYAAASDGDAYHDGHLYATAWTAASTANKEKALVFATRLIDAEYHFYGTQLKSTQALQWPREDCPDPDGPVGESLASDTVPAALIRATCELARELLIVDRTAAPAGEGIYLQRAADLSETVYSKRDSRPIISYVAQSMLAKLGQPVRNGGGTSRLLRT